MSSTSRSATFLVKLYPEEKDRLAALAASKGISLSEAFRAGAEQYLTAEPIAAAQTAAEDDELLSELQALAGKVDRRLRRGR